MIGLNRFTMVECPSCKSGRSLELNEIEQIQDSAANLSNKVSCTCGHEYSYLDGIIQDLISDNIFSKWSFISNITLYGTSKITIGYLNVVQLPQKVPEINKIFLTCIGGFANVTSIIQGTDSFRIISSEIPKGVPVGEKLEVSWLLYGRDSLESIPIWRRLLVQAKEEIIQNQYNLAYLTSEMAFESFIDSTLNQLLTAKGIPDEASNVILESMSSIFDKVHRLLLYLGGIKVKDNKNFNKNWQAIVEKRNKIAHGEVFEISAEEAKMAFETVIKGIFYIIQKTSS